MAGETNVIDYAGTARPWDAAIEPVLGGPLRAGYLIKQWQDAEGCTCRGYRFPDGRLVGSRFVLSPAEQAAADAAAAAKTADDTAGQQFDDRCEVLFAKARAHAQDTSNPSLTTREINEAVARLFRLARQIRKLT